MRGPTQALIWSAFSLSWPVLLIQIAGVLCAVFLITLSMDSDVDSGFLISAIDLTLIVSISFLYLTTVNRRQNSGRNSSSLGFPYRLEFSQPVSTATLTFVPLFFFCALTQIALFVPGTIINLLFLNTEISFLPISFALFQFTIFPLMLAWWTRNGLASLLGWLVTLALYFYGFLLPDFSRIENTWIVQTDSATNYIFPLMCTAAMMFATYLGVKQQRSGDSLFELGEGQLAKGEAGVLRDLSPLPNTQCPAESPLKAAIWKERQINGETRAVFGGLVCAASSIAILGMIDFFVPGASTVQLTNVLILTVSMYGAVCIGLMVSMFGVHYRNGIASVGVHVKTTPLSTLHLTSIKISVSLLSALIAGFVTAVVFSILGPFFIENFQEIQDNFLALLRLITDAGFIDSLLRIVLLLLAFFTVLILIAIFLTWSMLHGRAVAIACGLICIYLFLLVNGLSAIYREDENFNALLGTALLSHLWIATLAIPFAMAGMLRQLMRDEVINRTILVWLLVIGGVLQGLHLTWLLSASHFDALAQDIGITIVSYLIMQGFLPLLALVLGLWTMNRIRHG